MQDWVMSDKTPEQIKLMNDYDPDYDKKHGFEDPPDYNQGVPDNRKFIQRESYNKMKTDIDVNKIFEQRKRLNLKVQHTHDKVKRGRYQKQYQETQKQLENKVIEIVMNMSQEEKNEMIAVTEDLRKAKQKQRRIKQLYKKSQISEKQFNDLIEEHGLVMVEKIFDFEEAMKQKPTIFRFVGGMSDLTVSGILYNLFGELMSHHLLGVPLG